MGSISKERLRELKDLCSKRHVFFINLPVREIKELLKHMENNGSGNGKLNKN